MKIGKYGLHFTAVAVLAFILAFFGFVEALIFVTAFALLAEKEPWLIRQTLQALYLRFAYGIVLIIFGWIFGGLHALIRGVRAYDLLNGIGRAHNLVNGALYIGLFALAALAAIRLIKGQDAGIPGISRLVDFTMGLKRTASVPSSAQPPVPQPIQQTMPSPAPEAPAPSAPPKPEPPQAPAPEPAKAPEAKAEVAAAPEPKPEPMAAEAGSWVCACGRSNKGKFCVQCGTPKPV